MNESKQLIPFEVFKKKIAAYNQNQWNGALPKHINAENFSRACITYCNQNPKLLECHEGSLWSAFMQIAQLGLYPENFLGEAYVVPFWNHKEKMQYAVPIPGYRGLMKLAYQSEFVGKITSHCVREGDHFKITYGLEEKLEHNPKPNNKDKVIGAYAVASFVNGEKLFKYLDLSEIEARRDKSAGWQAYQKKIIKDTPWITDFEAMAEKTAIRKLSKFIPQSPMLHRGIAMEEQSDLRIVTLDDGTQCILPDEEQPTPPTPKASDKLMGEKKQEPEQVYNNSGSIFDDPEQELHALLSDNEESIKAFYEKKKITYSKIDSVYNHAIEFVKSSQGDFNSESVVVIKKDLTGFLEVFTNWLKKK